MSILIQCPSCGNHVCPRILNALDYLYKDNRIITSNGKCSKCGERYFYIEKSKTLYEIVFPFLDYGFCKPLKKLENIYTSYMPIPFLVEEYKEKILSIKKKNDIVIGFDGWEDIVIDKSFAGGWYMTYNSPPVLDVAIINCSNRCFGVPNIFMSYFPTPLLDGKVKIIDNRDFDFFGNHSGVMLDEKRTFYLGIKG